MDEEDRKADPAYEICDVDHSLTQPGFIHMIHVYEQSGGTDQQQRIIIPDVIWDSSCISCDLNAYSKDKAKNTYGIDRPMSSDPVSTGCHVISGKDVDCICAAKERKIRERCKLIINCKDS